MLYIWLPMKTVKHAGEPVVKEQKHIRQSVTPRRYTNWGYPKGQCGTAIVKGLEYDPWVRSARSSRRVLTALTWRRGTVAMYWN